MTLEGNGANMGFPKGCDYTERHQGAQGCIDGVRVITNGSWLFGGPQKHTE